MAGIVVCFVFFFLIKNQNITKKKNLKAKKQNTNISVANRIVRKHILSFQLLIQEQKKEITIIIKDVQILQKYNSETGIKQQNQHQTQLKLFFILSSASSCPFVSTSLTNENLNI